MINGAIIHFPESEMAYLRDNGNIVIVLKAQKGDLRKVVLFYDDRYDQVPAMQTISLYMENVMSDEIYDYFKVEFRCEYRRLCYYFSLTDFQNNHSYLYEDGFSTSFGWGKQKLFNFPYIHKEDSANVPSWMKESVMYQIFPDSFADGKETLSKEGKEISLPSGHTVSTKLGGTLKGIEQNIGYLEDLGVTLIYLNPIFSALSYHKYDTIDFHDIDPCFGTKEDFKRLVEACHKRGIRVMLDLIFNHCSVEFFAFQDVIKNGANSKYSDWFHIQSFPVVMGSEHNYETFGYISSMPKINTANIDVQKYLLDITTYWLTTFGFDGYRLDVANEVSHSFWNKFRETTMEINPSCAIIGEVWHSSNSWLGYNQFHSVMNYPLLYSVWDFFAFGSMNTLQFQQAINRIYMKYPLDNTFAMMNFIDTHDVGRFLTMAKNNVEKLKVASAFILTYPGLPSIYYGDEKGSKGNDLNDCRREMIWNDDEKSRDLFIHFKKLIKLRKENDLLIYGEYRPFFQDVESRIVGFTRELNGSRIICLFNGSDKTEKIAVKLTGGEYYDYYNDVNFVVEKEGLKMCTLIFPPFGVKMLLEK